MSDIATKLTYLDTTREKIKESINITGVGITEQDTFRSYEHKLKQGLVDIINKGTDEVYENFPKVSGNGSDISLENTYESKMKIDMGGDTEQESTSGKNLLPINVASGSTKNGLTITKNKDGSYTLNGTTSANTTWDLYTGENITIPVGTYTGSIIGRTNIVDGYIRLNNGAYQTIFTNSSDNNTFTINEPFTFNRFYIYITSGKTFDNQIIKFQLENGSTVTEWEEYTNGASPNPDYPQDIKTVTGRQEIGVTGKNLFEEIPTNGYSASSGALNRSTTGEYGNVKANITYTFSFNMLENNATYMNLRLNNNVSLSQLPINSGIGRKEITFIPNQDGFINFWTPNGCFTGDTKIIENAMLEKSSTASEYEPYKSQSYEVDLDDIELCKIGDYKDYIKKSTGKNLFDKDNTNKINGYISANGNIVTNVNARSVYIPIESSKTYTVSRIAGSNFIVGSCSVIPENGVSCSVLKRNNTATNLSITTGENDIYLVVFYYLSNTDTLTEQEILDSIQIEENNQATEYEPYGTDWYIKKEIGKVVFDGSESWQTNSYEDNYYRYVIPLGDSITTTNQNLDIYTKSDYFVGSSARGTITSTPTENMIAIISNNRLLVNTIDSNLFTVNAFKTWLSTHNTIVYYVLATPTYETITQQNYPTLYEDLTNLENAISYNEKTYISVQGNLPSLLEVVALGDGE